MIEVILLGLDFGTTTSRAVAAKARLVRNAVTGRTEFSNLHECYRSPIVLTPIQDNRLDTTRLSSMLDDWLTAAGAPYGGGALLTGLTAQADNADWLVQTIRARVGDAVVARANDPHHESWLAFMGNCVKLSRDHPDKYVLNLDIGGGTTNLALGRAGEVLASDCQYIGARHITVEPGTYRITGFSQYARDQFQRLGLRIRIGESLTRHDRDMIFQDYMQSLIVCVNQLLQAKQIVNVHDNVVVTLSGGVGEIVYNLILQKDIYDTTAYGDLGIDMAQYLIRYSPWAKSFGNFIPAAGGRATSFGLLRHSTQLTGSTLYLPQPELLPLRDVPIFGTLHAAADATAWQGIMRLLVRGGCVKVSLADRRAAAVRDLGHRLAASLPVSDTPIVLLVPGNVGKTLGSYITQWGARPRALIVLDEVDVPDARFLHLGRLREGVVPVSFHGLQA